MNPQVTYEKNRYGRIDFYAQTRITLIILAQAEV